LEKKKKDSKDRKRDRRKSRGVSLQGGGMTMSILELLQHIVNEPAPKLMPEGRFPKEAEDFVNSCLLKEPEHRRTPKDLLVRDRPTLSARVPRKALFFDAVPLFYF
jgi:mitogen-activated protein kinase kinase